MEKKTKVALVTGASRGLGEALARELVKSGWIVVGVARSGKTLDILQKAVGSNFIPYICDVSVPDQVRQVSEDLKAKGMIPSLFFLNAGIAGEAACESSVEFTAAKHKEIFATNYFGVLLWVEQWLPTLKDEKATFVATGSVNAIFAPPLASAYAASKAAIAKAFESLSLTHCGSKLVFSIVYAGPIATDGLKGTFPFTWQPEKMAKYMIKKTSKGKTHVENSFFYSGLSRVFRWLPNRLTMKILRCAN